MRAAAMDEFGPPEVVHVETVPVPDLGDDQVLVQVATAGVGTWDPELVDGSFQDTEIRFPRVIGSDGAGTIVAVGGSVQRFEVGDHVYGWGFGNPKGGFFAEYAAVDEENLAAIPETLSFDEAGALAVSGITALQGLEQLGLEEDDRIMIIGASGGVGHVAVQLAKRLGLKVFAIASQDDGVALVRKLGADDAAEGHKRALAGRLRGFAPDGFDGALVFTGGDGWEEELALVRRGGIIASPNGVDPAPVASRGVEHKVYDGAGSPAAFQRLNELIAQGPFHVELSRTYPLHAAAQALRDVQRHHIGKLALAVAAS
ncbi:MAG: NADP-dependent oxidoreductase [Deltaproteobacteria bacterium]|nr:NADP-dependent oxidoreductase [Deltaproteobacteria bacterium]MCW5806020.1 NADP-dependent oxidoreductase [Deltaproteobacteria bacterium]